MTVDSTEPASALAVQADQYPDARGLSSHNICCAVADAPTAGEIER